jgi:hypothetical protein
VASQGTQIRVGRASYTVSDCTIARLGLRKFFSLDVDLLYSIDAGSLVTPGEYDEAITARKVNRKALNFYRLVMAPLETYLLLPPEGVTPEVTIYKLTKANGENA